MDISDTPPAEPASTAPAAPQAGRLWNRNFFLLWQGQTISQLGNQAFAVAMSFWIVEKTGSASIMGLLLSLSVFPGVLLAPFGGTFADRHSRVRILVVCDLLAGLGTLALTALLATASSVRPVLAALFVVSILGGIVRSFFAPAIQASIPDLVPRERLAAANSLNQFAVQTSMLVGQAAGGLLYQHLGAFLLFLFDGLSFLFAGASSAAIQLPETPKGPRAGSAREALRHFLADTASGVRYVFAQQGLRNFVAIAALLNFFFSPELVLLPFYVKNQLGAKADWYGYLLAGMGAGTIAGFLLAGVLQLKGETRGRALLAGLILGPALYGVLGSVRTPWVALVLACLSGLCFGFINIFILTLLQSSTPAELRGRVLGFLATLGGGLMPIGMGLSGWLGDLTHKNVPLLFGAASALSVLSTLLLSMGRGTRAFLAQEG